MGGGCASGEGWGGGGGGVGVGGWGGGVCTIDILYYNSVGCTEAAVILSAFLPVDRAEAGIRQPSGLPGSGPPTRRHSPC